uniref:Transposase n=1 Tax=Globodera pallida TaxID=36090 RepID=A0A183CQA6_GLOPA
MRKNDIATAILQRKIQSFTIDLHKLEDERKALEIELFAIESKALHSFAGGSLIDIFSEQSSQAMANEYDGSLTDSVPPKLLGKTLRAC